MKRQDLTDVSRMTAAVRLAEGEIVSHRYFRLSWQIKVVSRNSVSLLGQGRLGHTWYSVVGRSRVPHRSRT